MKKKVLVVDDSALMRRVVCDIILEDEEFEVEDTAANGLEALELLMKKSYSCVILDVNMPKMSGIELLKELNKRRISAKIIMNSTMTKEGARITIEALELGAIDFIHKPDGILQARADTYKQSLKTALKGAVIARPFYQSKKTDRYFDRGVKSGNTQAIKLRNSEVVAGEKLVAIASSTGGPKALADVITKLPKNLAAPILIVQHMPPGFTNSLAERLNSLSELPVKEAEEGDILRKGHVYVARGGKHLKVKRNRERNALVLSDEPPREGVKPCANYMYESLVDLNYKQIICVVLTGMGSDGTKGILQLQTKKLTHVIAQSENTCVVYGMPRAIVTAGAANEIVPLDEIAEKITKNVGVE